jgi:hypothetical protein
MSWRKLVMRTSQMPGLAVALLLGAGYVVGYLAAAGALAAWQLAHYGRRDGADPRVAGPLAAVLPFAALESTALAGTTLIAGAVVSVLVGFLAQGNLLGALSAAGATTQAWLVPGLAVAGVGFTWRAEVGAVVVLLTLASVYDAGAYLVGADARHGWSGPIAGVVAVAAASFTAAAIGIPPFDLGAAVAFGALAAAAFVLGPMLASVLLPTGRERAPFVRRVDVYFVVGLIWPIVVGLYVDVGG